MKKLTLSIFLLFGSFAQAGEIGHLASELLMSDNFKCARKYIEQENKTHNLTLNVQNVIEGKLKSNKNSLGLEDHSQQIYIETGWTGENEGGDLDTLVYKVSTSAEYYSTSYSYEVINIITSNSPSRVGKIPSYQEINKKCLN